MKTRPVKGWALKDTACGMFEDGESRLLVLRDGQLLRFDGHQAPVPVLGPGPRPLGVLDAVVYCADGSRAALGGLDDREEDVDGLGLVQVSKVDGALVTLDERGDLRHVTLDEERIVTAGVQVLLDANASAVLLSSKAGLVMHDLGTGAILWSRPTRGAHGERITAATMVEDGGVLVAREGYAMTGDEDVVEVEFWVNGALEWRHAHHEVVLGLASTSIGVVAHDQSGSVLRLMAEGTSVIHDAGSGVRAMVDLGGELCVAAWFHVHGLAEDGRVWTVEHPGMPTALSVLGAQLLIVGDDGNDWTGPEPLGVVDLEADVVEMDPSELTAWVPPPIQENDEVPAMVDVAPSLDEEEEEHAWSAPSGLLDALTETAPSAEAAEENDDDLLSALTDETPSSVASTFSVGLGEHRQVRAGAEGVAEVLLESTVSGAPSEGVTYAWSTADGREIGTKSRLLVRLPRGAHRFELRVRHPDGRWAMDGVQVHVE